MAIKVSANNLSVVLEKMLGEYAESVRQGVKKDVHDVAVQCRDEIKAKSPVDTGKYRAGWATRTAFESFDDIRMEVYNRSKPELTHLLENGHAKVNGGRVSGRPHIRPAEQHAVEELDRRVKVTVKKG